MQLLWSLLQNVISSSLPNGRRGIIGKVFDTPAPAEPNCEYLWQTRNYELQDPSMKCDSAEKSIFFNQIWQSQFNMLRPTTTVGPLCLYGLQHSLHFLFGDVFTNDNQCACDPQSHPPPHLNLKDTRCRTPNATYRAALSFIRSVKIIDRKKFSYISRLIG